MRGWLSVPLLLLAMAGAAHAAGAPLAGGKLPNGGRPLERVAFPAIHDWSTLKITLQRTMCFGRCPAYTVEIAGDGTVNWHGSSDVAAIGARGDKISAADVKILFGAFRDADFFWLLDNYNAQITDLPSYIVSIAYDGRRKTVSDYAGLMIGMPHAVVDLETLIDKTANTGRWIKADEPR